MSEQPIFDFAYEPQTIANVPCMVPGCVVEIAMQAQLWTKGDGTLESPMGFAVKFVRDNLDLHMFEHGASVEPMETT